jgi:hypothetical protein
VPKGQSPKAEYVEDGKSTPADRNACTDVVVDDILWELVGSRDDIALGLDHTNKSRSLWAKADSIFIR